MTITVEGTDITVLAEVAQQLGQGRVRRVHEADRRPQARHRGAQPRPRHPGARRRPHLGHVWNVWGEVLDGDNAEFADIERWDIHRPAPAFDALEPSKRVFETGIKVIDLLTPYVAGGKIGLFGGAGVGKTVLITEMIRRGPRTTVVCRCSPELASAPVRAPTSCSR
ncbi:MAG: hypothetical protein R2705_12325 [Ilumatobacteraceae bacterium]